MPLVPFVWLSTGFGVADDDAHHLRLMSGFQIGKKCSYYKTRVQECKNHAQHNL